MVLPQNVQPPLPKQEKPAVKWAGNAATARTNASNAANDGAATSPHGSGKTLPGGAPCRRAKAVPRSPRVRKTSAEAARKSPAPTILPSARVFRGREVPKRRRLAGSATTRAGRKGVRRRHPILEPPARCPRRPCACMDLLAEGRSCAAWKADGRRRAPRAADLPFREAKKNPKRGKVGIPAT